MLKLRSKGYSDCKFMQFYLQSSELFVVVVKRFLEDRRLEVMQLRTVVSAAVTKQTKMHRKKYCAL